MARIAGTKNRKTILREAEERMLALGVNDHKDEFLDSLYVIEAGMRHFYTRAMAAKAVNAPIEIVEKNLLQAAALAEKVAPYRHARLSAVKLAGDPNNPLRVYDGASADDLREEIMKHLARLSGTGVLDLEALPMPGEPAEGIANRSVATDAAE